MAGIYDRIFLDVAPGASVWLGWSIAEMTDGNHGMAIDNLPPLREVIAAHGLAAKKQLGQRRGGPVGRVSRGAVGGIGQARGRGVARRQRSEERRVGKECC